MQKRLVLIGGGHAHMATLANLKKIIEKGHRVTVIGPSDYHYYSGMGPGMLSGTYRPEEVRFATRQVVEKQGGTFLSGSAVSIDPEKKVVILENGDLVPYDVLSCNAGSHVPKPPIDGDLADIFSVKPIERLMQAKSRLIDHFGRHAPGCGHRRRRSLRGRGGRQCLAVGRQPPAGTVRASQSAPAVPSCPVFPLRSGARSSARWADGGSLFEKAST